MKISFYSPYEKKLKYKIYGFDGNKRELIGKGKFLHNIETDIKIAENQLIVRVQRYNILIAFLRAVCVVIANLFYIPNRKKIVEATPQYLSLYPFEEIRIAGTNSSETINIQYNAAPLTRMVYRSDRPEKNMIVDYLTCSTHKYNSEYSGQRKINKVLYAFAVIFWIALIAAVCLAVRFFVLHLSAA